MRAISVIAVGLGIVLMLASLAWNILFPATRSWTNEKTQQMTDLGIKAHKLGGELDDARRHPRMHGGRRAADIEAEYQQVVEQHQQLKEEFESKRDAPKRATRFLRWSGVAFIIAGAMVIMATRSA